MRKKKLKTKSGFTMVEMLCVVLILALLSAVIAVGMALCNKAFVETKTRSESSMLTASLDSLISDELRYASNIQLGATNLTYNSTARGLRNVQIIIYNDPSDPDNMKNGKFFLRQAITDGGNTRYEYTMLLGAGSYIANCRADDLKITYDSGVFTVSYDLIFDNPRKPNESRIEEESFQVKSLRN